MIYIVNVIINNFLTSRYLTYLYRFKTKDFARFDSRNKTNTSRRIFSAKEKVIYYYHSRLVILSQSLIYGPMNQIFKGTL